MKIRKDRLILGISGALALLLTDQPKRQVPAYWETALAPTGSGHFIIRQEGDITLKLVSARLGAGNLEIVPVPFYQEGGPHLRSIMEIAKRFTSQTQRPVLAAINGGFFDTATGLPIGFLLRDGQMDFFNMPQGFQRSMVGFSAPGVSGEASHIWVSSPKKMPKVWLETFSVGGALPLRTSTLAVHHINVPGGRHALALFTPTYAASVEMPDNALYLTAMAEPGRPGVFRIADIFPKGRVHIPPGGLVVALHGDARGKAKFLLPGTLVRPRWTLPEDWKEHHVAHGLLAGPRLLEGGKILVTAKEERLDHLVSRDRMALAVKPDGDALLVWAHKNTPGNLSYEQVAEELSKMGAYEAIALDGGKSRAIFAQSGSTLADERYFEGGRPVANALVLAVKTPTHS